MQHGYPSRVAAAVTQRQPKGKKQRVRTAEGSTTIAAEAVSAADERLANSNGAAADEATPAPVPEPDDLAFPFADAQSWVTAVAPLLHQSGDLTSARLLHARVPAMCLRRTWLHRLTIMSDPVAPESTSTNAEARRSAAAEANSAAAVSSTAATTAATSATSSLPTPRAAV